MNLEKIKLPDEILSVINTIEQNGFEAYIVGGAVRSFLLGQAVSDYDVTTSARPDDIEKMFKKVYKTGEKHGTVTVKSGDFSVEVTTYRVDGKYKNHRKPQNVTFSSSLDEDLKRRDFTINAMAYNPKVGIVDLFGGKEDLKNKLIRTVGEADKRFSEDALRILRAVRFSAVLGFDIESETKKAMAKNAHLLKHISAERKKS